MHVFYTPDLVTNDYSLNEEESKHCNKVLRLSIGDHVFLVDGKGGFYEAEIINSGKKNVMLHVILTKKEYHKRNHHLHIAIAPTKNIDRLEWFLEKATEIGIDEITTLISERSERKIIKQDRLFKVITSAVKQSLQAYHPVLNPAISFTDFLKGDHDAVKLVAHCEEGEPRRYISEIIDPHQRYLILIGPEGDFSPNEIALTIANGFQPVTLGNTRLRTETAALAACFEVNYLHR
ncbi:16S rRNA (uracil1498-N3)-methyltransferase [Pedobacter sp. CG_S7]|uniref:16S rRNA (uracil(1498)-N(3))-methyltransferase n=1 Tax=Pedobacter sp. CG_S7 TaxID=3143930 RepID=UPI0033959439